MENSENLIDQFLLPFDDRLVSLVQELRQFFKGKTKPKYELVGDSTISVNIGYGFTEKAWDCFCAIIVYSKHINLSFPSGAFISDPKNLLIGTGKRIRHIKIADFDDMTNPDVLNLILESKSRALENFDNKNIQSKDVKTIVKPIKGIKKRPK
jgi:hypothetical protein